MKTSVNNNNIESKKTKAERQERYNARCKELEAEALTQMPYRVGDAVKSRDGVTGRVVEMYPEVTGNTDSPHLIYEYDGKPTVNIVILDADGKRHCAHWSFFMLQEASEIKDGTEVWTTIELHPEYGKRGKVVRKFFADHGVWCLDIEFEDGTKATYAEEYVTTEKPWAVVGAKCHHKYLNRDMVLTITAVGHYYGIEAESEDGKVKRCGLVRDFEPVEIVTEAEGVKVGDKVRHNKHEEVATVTAIREAFVNGCDSYRYLYTLDFGQSVKGPFDVELNGGEFLREAFTICDPDGRKFRDFTTWNGVTVKAEERQQWTKIFADGIISKVKLDGGKSTYKHNAGFIAVRIAYRNGSDKPEEMSYCVSWYRWKDAEGREAEIVECENGVSIWVAARAMADFHLLANKVGFATIDEILNPCKRPKVA